jgi:hypothetical protein
MKGEEKEDAKKGGKTKNKRQGGINGDGKKDLNMERRREDNEVREG